MQHDHRMCPFLLWGRKMSESLVWKQLKFLHFLVCISCFAPERKSHTLQKGMKTMLRTIEIQYSSSSKCQCKCAPKTIFALRIFIIREALIVRRWLKFSYFKRENSNWTCRKNVHKNRATTAVPNEIASLDITNRSSQKRAAIQHLVYTDIEPICQIIPSETTNRDRLSCDWHLIGPSKLMEYA